MLLYTHKNYAKGEGGDGFFIKKQLFFVFLKQRIPGGVAGREIVL